MKLLFIILAIVACLHLANCCCCSLEFYYMGSCGCNFFYCNCKTINGYCVDKDEFGWCISTKGIHGMKEVCAAKRRKRSMDTKLMEDYKEKYGHLIGLPELDLFYTFDTDKDGFINIEEARASLNVTLDAFKEVDTNRDGFIQPAEFDSSLE
eukprot:GFUD01076466.1.p1 GENE.GFUD01076466.1~~GFUD01076466.1.p1  ORF type:complete len:152 (+),score=35.64 GFUD01076466.1:48-503(+)